jgi:hypothetical protein
MAGGNLLRLISLQIEGSAPIPDCGFDIAPDLPDGVHLLHLFFHLFYPVLSWADKSGTGLERPVPVMNFR